jgi:hypothetical protein
MPEDEEGRVTLRATGRIVNRFLASADRPDAPSDKTRVFAYHTSEAVLAEIEKQYSGKPAHKGHRKSE